MSRENALYGKEEIIRVAVEIVDTEGIKALSVRRVAKDLGVSAMTLYNYVENLRDIKKYVLINGFDRLYASIYQALNKLDAPVNNKVFCKTIAMQVFKFARENREIFLFMFSDGQQLFSDDAEIRPFYAFLRKLMKRSKATQSSWDKNETAYQLFDVILFSVAYRYATESSLMEEQLESYVDFILSRCLE